jgi:hypothetical protein
MRFASRRPTLLLLTLRLSVLRLRNVHRLAIFKRI